MTQAITKEVEAVAIALCKADDRGWHWIIERTKKKYRAKARCAILALRDAVGQDLANIAGTAAHPHDPPSDVNMVRALKAALTAAAGEAS